MSGDKEFFTLVFAGDAGAISGNPFKIITPYGTPVAVGRGNAFDTIDELEEALGPTVEPANPAFVREHAARLLVGIVLRTGGQPDHPDIIDLAWREMLPEAERLLEALSAEGATSPDQTTGATPGRQSSSGEPLQHSTTHRGGK